MFISIIIPTLNEEAQLAQLIPHLKNDPSYQLIKEIIVVDADSNDNTTKVAQEQQVTVVSSKAKGRSLQMNLGAEHAKGEILYFLHADTFPPMNFAANILAAIRDGHSYGCFRLRFDWRHWFLQANSWFTRFDVSSFRFGDQSLFVKRSCFAEVKGFNNNLQLFEDQDIIDRLRSHGSFKLLSDRVVTSARKYRKNGPYRLQVTYFILYLMYRLGVSQNTMLRTYTRLIPYPRV